MPYFTSANIGCFLYRINTYTIGTEELDAAAEITPTQNDGFRLKHLRLTYEGEATCYNEYEESYSYRGANGDEVTE